MVTKPLPSAKEDTVSKRIQHSQSITRGLLPLIGQE
jgi:hypothetical protein